MSQRYDNTNRPKPKGSQKFMHFAGKFSRGPWVQESTARVMYLSMRIHPKSCYIFPIKVAATLLSGSRKVQLEHSSHIVKIGIEATC